MISTDMYPWSWYEMKPTGFSPRGSTTEPSLPVCFHDRSRQVPTRSSGFSIAILSRLAPGSRLKGAEGLGRRRQRRQMVVDRLEARAHRVHREMRRPGVAPLARLARQLLDTAFPPALPALHPHPH